MRKKNLNIRITQEDANRLDTICAKHGFTDDNQIIEYLVHCFLRVADPANDPITEPVPEEIKNMFLSHTDEIQELQKECDMWKEMAMDVTEILNEITRSLHGFIKLQKKESALPVCM